LGELTKAGEYHTFIEMIDSVGLGYGVCPIHWPDTSYQPSMIVKVIEGLKTRKESAGYTIFPNPAHSWIAIPRYKQNEIRVYSLLGKEQKPLKLENDGFNVSRLKTGIYFLYDKQNHLFIGKFIKM